MTDDLDFLHQSCEPEEQKGIYGGGGITQDDILCEMVGRSRKMKDVFEQIRKFKAKRHVMILGESGTGKGCVAHTIYQLSSNIFGPLIVVNCKSNFEDFLEPNFFSQKEEERITIFLDEAGKLSDKWHDRVFDMMEKMLNIRFIITITENRDNDNQQDLFKKKFLRRFNGASIILPRLIERREDIPLLISYFLNHYGQRSLLNFKEDAIECLMNYDWPGNISELENLIERISVVKKGGNIRVDDLPEKIRHSSPLKSLFLPEEGINLRKMISSIENDFIRKALIKTDGNKNKAAKLLGLNRTTFIEKLKKVDDNPCQPR